MTTVVDASALLARLKGEAGSEIVESALCEAAHCSAANWSEIAQKILAAGGDWQQARALLLNYGLRIEPVTVDDAEWAARRWRPGEGLSLADRLCLALAARLRARILTADAAWGSEAGIVQIR